MITPAKLQALIAKLEAATEGSLELSDEVLLTCGWTVERGKFDDYWTTPSGDLWRYEATRSDPTRSLDDTLAVMLKGKCWRVQSEYQGADPTAFVGGEEAEAPTPALAFCIAALKAWKEKP